MEQGDFRVWLGKGQICKGINDRMRCVGIFQGNQNGIRHKLPPVMKNQISGRQADLK
jgi:hypothetical protein